MGDVERWRVVDDAGVTREVAVCPVEGAFVAEFPAEPSWPSELGTNARGAVLRVCALCRIAAVEVRGPGELTTAEVTADLCTRVDELEEDAAQACESPADDCQCAGCSYAAEKNGAAQ